MRRPWILVQTWENVLFAHWPVPAERLRSLAPASLEVDLYQGQAWIGVVAFQIHIALRGLPALRFEELNVRTYVTRRGRSGVYFFSLDASSRLAVRAARQWFHLPYYDAAIAVREREGWVDYECRRIRGEERFQAQYRPSGPILAAEPGGLEDWLTNRLCLFTTDAAGRIWRGDVAHQPWRLQPAEARIAANTMANLHGLLPMKTPLLHFARQMDRVYTWTLAPG